MRTMQATRRMRGVWWATAGACALAASLLGCAGGAPKPTPVAGRVDAAPQVNPDARNRPSPVLVRVYELKAPTAFNGADFMSLFQGDATALGAELVSKDEMTLSPGESRPWSRTLAPETRWIGVFAAYRDLEHARWRAVAAIEPGRKQQVVVQAGELAVTVSVSR